MAGNGYPPAVYKKINMHILYTIIIYPITLIFEFVFVAAQNLFKETGLSIICVSAAFSVLCLPLYLVAEKWQEIERNVQKQLAPKIAKIKAAFKGDERYMVLSTYYRQNHYHPIYTMRSTFGLLIQIPFFIAAYSYLSHLEALRGVSFLFINDLGKPDMLAGGINVLPFVMTLINCASGAVYTKGLAFKDKIQLYGMALVFLALLYNSPAGLVLYWTLNNVFSLVKNIYLKIPFKKKRQLLWGAISTCAFLLAYYSLFILHGSPRVRTLVAALAIVGGISPWIIPFLSGLFKKITYTPWTLKETLPLFLFSALILWMATGIFIPSMLIDASPQEFSFIDNNESPLFFVLAASVQALGLFILWPLMLYFLFPEKTKKAFSLLAIIVALSALGNMFVFSGNYGPISVDLVFSGTVTHDLKDILVNVLVLVVLIAIISFIYLRGNKKILPSLALMLFIALASLSVKTIHSINVEFKKLSEYFIREYKTSETISPIFHLSRTGKNVLVLMLDMAQSVFIPYIFEESPELNQKYDGFVYYPNTVTFNGWTEGGAPPIFGGYEYTPQGINERPEVALEDKAKEALFMLPRIFSSAGFSVTITDPPYAGGNWIPDLRIYDELSDVNAHITDGVYTNLWLEQNNIALLQRSEVLNRNIMLYAIFRASPLAFRQAIYYRGSWFAPFSENRMRLFLGGYAVLDFLSQLTDFDSPKSNSAIFMVNNTTHEFLTLQAPLYKPQLTVTDYGNSRFNKEDFYHINAAAIKRLSEFFDFLKLNNVYDNTRIILVSDHGVLENTYITRTNLPFSVDQFNPILLVKDFNAKGEIKTDMTFMSTADVPALAIQNLTENPVNPFTGNSINSDRKSEPLLILTKRVRGINNTTIELSPHNTYYVHDNIFDEKNWFRSVK
jgi:YidC/Oxa1 family membrane protein insertase